jgi:hypothetical protein
MITRDEFISWHVLRSEQQALEYLDTMDDETLERGIAFFEAGNQFLTGRDSELKNLYNGEEVLIPDMDLTLRRALPCRRLPTTVDDLVWSEGFEVVRVRLGFLSFTVLPIRSQWVARVWTVFTDGSTKLRGTSKPQPSSAAAWKQNMFKLFTLQLRLHLVAPGSYEELLIPPLGCTWVKPELELERLRAAEIQCKKARYPSLEGYCIRAAASKSRNTLREYIRWIPHIKAQDVPVPCRGNNPSTNRLYNPFTNYIADRAGITPHEAEDDPYNRLINEESTTGYLRHPYGALSPSEQAWLINLKLGTAISPAALERRLGKHRLNLPSLQYPGRPSPFRIQNSPYLRCPESTLPSDPQPTEVEIPSTRFVIGRST